VVAEAAFWLILVMFSEETVTDENQDISGMLELQHITTYFLVLEDQLNPIVTR